MWGTGNGVHRSWTKTGTNIFQANFRIVEGAEWDNTQYKFVEMNKVINIRSPGGSIRASMLWNISEPKGSGDAYYDQTSEQIVNRDALRHELLKRYLQKPALALTEAVRRVEEWKGAGTSTAEGARKWAMIDITCGVVFAPRLFFSLCVER